LPIQSSLSCPLSLILSDGHAASILYPSTLSQRLELVLIHLQQPCMERECFLTSIKKFWKEKQTNFTPLSGWW
jgi:hypothetical protein